MEFRINTENLSEKEIALLRKLEEKAIEKSVWKPHVDDIYWYVRDFKNFDCDKWKDDEIDNFRYSIGNVYKTREEAEFAVEKLKVIAELKRYAEWYNDKIDWKDDNSCKFDIFYDYGTGEMIIFSYNSVQHNSIYFSSKEIAENAIKEIGVERIKKYYLEVE